jgi:putative transposase
MDQTNPLVTGEIYHIYSKSIYGYKIFNRPEDFQRLLDLSRYYQWEKMPPFSHFTKSFQTQQLGFKNSLLKQTRDNRRIIQLICYCVMETHVHFILKQLADGGITRFMRRLMGGYSLYFNLLHHRHGPLWQSRFGRRRIENLGDLISTSHYVHSNPVKDMGHPTPMLWAYSSYQEFIGKVSESNGLCQWQEDIPLDRQTYHESMYQYLKNKGLPFQSPFLIKPFRNGE